jgi:hypothetical protein
VIKAEQDRPASFAQALLLLGGRAIENLNRDVLKKPRKLLGQFLERALDQVEKMRFAHMIRHR